MKLKIEDQSYEVAVKGDIVDVDGAEFAASVAETPPFVTVNVNGRPFKAQLKKLEGTSARGRPGNPARTAPAHRCRHRHGAHARSRPPDPRPARRPRRGRSGPPH